MKSALTRTLVLIHRYLGLVMAAVMTVWCLSGFVMIYQGYPELTARQRLAGLAPLALEDCCRLPALNGSEVVGLTGFQLEMLADRPVAHVAFGRDRAVYDLRTGAALEAVAPDLARQVALGQAAALDIRAPVRAVHRVKQDQWTVQLAWHHQPLYRVRFDDTLGSDIYVSGRTGQAIQHTNAKIRLLGWLGAVPHWLYPTILRQDGALWNDVVVALSMAGTFLTATGLYVGIIHLRRRRNGRHSPFRGLWFWHHMIGLTFGVLTLTWVFSGLMTMNPGGVLERGDRSVVRDALRGPVTGEDIDVVFQKSMAGVAPPGSVQLSSLAFDGEVALIAESRGGQRQRLDAEGRPGALTPERLDGLAQRLAADRRELVHEPDAYFYQRRAGPPLVLPAYRMSLPDTEQTWAYIHPTTGETLAIIDRSARISRWIRTGLHRLDFAWLGPRPVWDFVVLSLLAGVTFVCGTGLLMGWRRMLRDVASLQVWLTRRRPAPTGRPARFSLKPFKRTPR